MIKVYFEEENDFLHVWLIFVQVLSENVVAMATREGLSFQFFFQNNIYVYFRKSHKLSRKKLLSFGVMLEKPQGGGGGEGE